MSNDRSPREVCSITIGINGLISFSSTFLCVDWSFQTVAWAKPMRLEGTSQAASPSGWLLAAWGPQFRLRRWFFLVRCPDSLARLGLLGRNPLDLGRDAVERLRKAHCLSLGLEGPGFTRLL